MENGGIVPYEAKAILDAEVLVLQRDAKKHTVQLYSNCLKLSLYGSKSQHLIIDLFDIVGCKCLKLEDVNEKRSESWCEWAMAIFSHAEIIEHLSEDLSIFLSIYYYPFTSKKDPIRRRKVITLVYNSLPTYDENFEVMKKWKHVILLMLRSKVGHFQNSTAEDILSGTFTPRSYLVFVNPHSGSGKAREIYDKHVKQMMDDAEIHHVLITTEYGGHAHDTVYKAELEKYSGILIVSGDGLMFEVINGLMDREDWDMVRKIPIGIVAAGSGNAMATMICYLADEYSLKGTLQNSLFNVCRYLQPKPLDLVVVETSTDKYYSNLSVNYGMIADVDIETEKFRAIGDARFAIGAAQKILSPSFYRVRVSFLPVDNEEAQQKLSQHATQLKRSSTYNASTTPIDAFSDSIGTYRPIDSQNRLITAKGDTSRTHLVPFDQTVPVTWITIEDNFAQISACTSTHLATDFWGAPQAKFDDGIIYLTFIRKNISKSQLFGAFKALGNMKNSNFELAVPHIEVIRCFAYRIEPQQNKSYVTIDGENIGVTSVQGEVKPGYANMMCYTADDKVPVPLTQ